jgi:hypothetical protein
MFFVACFSSNSEARERSYMREEVLLAIDQLRKRPRGRAWFLPVALTPDAVPTLPIGAGESLHDIQYLSLAADWDHGINQLVEVIQPAAQMSGASTRPDQRASASSFPGLRPYLAAIMDELAYSPSADGLEGLASRLETSTNVSVQRRLLDPWPGRPPDAILNAVVMRLHNEVLLRSSDIHERGLFFEDVWDSTR